MSHAATEDWVAIAVTCEGSGTWDTQERDLCLRDLRWFKMIHDARILAARIAPPLLPFTFFRFLPLLSPAASSSLSPPTRQTERWVSVPSGGGKFNSTANYVFLICHLLTFQPLRQVAWLCKINIQTWSYTTVLHHIHTHITQAFKYFFHIN